MFAFALMKEYLIVFWKVRILQLKELRKDLQFRRNNGLKPIFVFNIHTIDSPEKAKEGARLALELAKMVIFFDETTAFYC